MNRGMTFSGYCRGPYTLLPRVMRVGRSKDLRYAFTMNSAAAFVAAYGLVGFSSALSFWCSSTSPYTSSVDTWTNFSIFPYTFEHSSRLWVPSTLVRVKHIELPKLLSTWVCAAKLMIVLMSCV